MYGFPYQHHATMEPMNATALWTTDRCEVWTATQNAEAALATAAGAAGLPIDKCDVYRLHLGGGFGRRATSHDFVRQAVLIAKQMPGTPVKLIWSREEDMLHGYYHPITKCQDGRGAWTRTATWSGCACASPASRSSRRSVPQGLQNGRDPATFQGLNPERHGRRVRLHHTEPAHRPRHAQSARAPGLLARREQQPERHLSRMLHGRARPCGRPGPAGVPPQADGEPSQAPGRAECRGREGGLGHARASGRLSRLGPAHGLWQLCGGLRGGLGRTTAAC